MFTLKEHKVIEDHWNGAREESNMADNHGCYLKMFLANC